VQKKWLKKICCFIMQGTSHDKVGVDCSLLIPRELMTTLKAKSFTPILICEQSHCIQVKQCSELFLLNTLLRFVMVSRTFIQQIYKKINKIILVMLFL
jgi:hypothetical protein